jgi:gp32 DNA binding protein like
MIMRADRKVGRDKTKKKGFQYKPRDEKKLKERAEQEGGAFDSIFKAGVDTWRPAQGDNKIRILPPTWEDHDHYGFDVWQHGYVGNGSYLCLSKMLQKRCPICEAARESRAAGEEEEAKRLSPSRRVVVWIVDRDADDPSVPLLWPMSWTMDRDIAALCHNKRTGASLLIDHPDEGYDLTFKRKGTGPTKTKYFGLAVERDASAISDDEKEQEGILEYIQENPIPSLLHYQSADYLKRMIEGEVEEKDEDGQGEDDEQEDGGDEEEGSKKRGGEENGSEDDEEEDDEEEGSKKRGGEENGSEDDEEEDDEEEDESKERKPVRRASRR